MDAEAGPNNIFFTWKKSTYAVPGLFSEGYSDLARAQQLQLYGGYIPAHSTHGAPPDGEYLLGKVGGTLAATDRFTGRCVRKVLETQKTSGRKSEKSTAFQRNAVLL